MQTWDHDMREAAILATISLSGQELRLVRLPDGLLALDSASNVLTIGTGRDMGELIKALQAVARIIGPIEGGT